MRGDACVRARLAERVGPVHVDIDHGRSSTVVSLRLVGTDQIVASIDVSPDQARRPITAGRRHCGLLGRPGIRSADRPDDTVRNLHHTPDAARRPQVWRCSDACVMLRTSPGADEATEQEELASSFLLALEGGSTAEALLAACCGRNSAASSSGRSPDVDPSAANPFDRKTDKGSADLYFKYYGMLQHQQNMLQARS